MMRHKFPRVKESCGLQRKVALERLNTWGQGVRRGGGGDMGESWADCAGPQLTLERTGARNEREHFPGAHHQWTRETEPPLSGSCISNALSGKGVAVEIGTMH